MKNIFYLLTGLAVVACGQQATAGWYDDIGASVLTSQQSEAVAVPLDDDAAISDQAVDDDDGDAPPVPPGLEPIVLGQSGIQEKPANEPPDKGDDPPDPPMPVPDNSVSEAPLIDATTPRESHSRQPGAPQPVPDAIISSEPVTITDTAARSVDSSGVHSSSDATNEATTPHYHVRYVKKRKSMLQKVIECERKKNAWIKKNILRL